MENSDTITEVTPVDSTHEKAPDALTPMSDADTSASKKRSTPEQSVGEPAEDSAAKKRRVDDTGLRSPPPEDVIMANLDTKPTFDHEPTQLLRRAAALALEHVGFDGASKEAFEELCGEVESYMMRFLSNVTKSMLSSRRSQSTPLDFQYALRCEGLTARLLKPHLKPPIAASRIQPVFIPVPPSQELVHRPFTGLLGEELSGASEMRTKSYIPKQFPKFPSIHTFKSTDVKQERETDPRKIREKATEEARHGEEALRRLVKVGKASDHRGTGKPTGKLTKQGVRHQLWVSAMEDIAAGKPQNTKPSGVDHGDDEQSIIVNSERLYGRKPIARRKDPSKERGS